MISDHHQQHPADFPEALGKKDSSAVLTTPTRSQNVSVGKHAARPQIRDTGVEGMLQPTSDPFALLAEDALSAEEEHYIGAARAANTVRGYRSDWAEFTAWCACEGRSPIPADASTVTGYLTNLAGHGARVGTMSRRLSAIKFAHRLQDLPDPTDQARVIAVWEGIRRQHATSPEQATPLMPPDLWDVLSACPATRTWKTPRRPAEPDLAGFRDRALLIVGFVAALRRSEISALDVEHIHPHPHGLVLMLPRSKTNQRGDAEEIVVLPRATNPQRCPVTLLQQWLQQAAITGGAVFRPVGKSNRPLPRRLSSGSVNDIVQAAVTRTGLSTSPAGQLGEQGDQNIGCSAAPIYSAHSLRAGFVTYAHLRGASDRAIAHQTRHRSLATIGAYIRVDNAWQDNAATQLGL
jgi:site-specific recombinase XerD